MPLYHVYRLTHIGYDEHDAFVVRAKNKKAAREIVVATSYGHEKQHWKNEKKSKVDLLPVSGKSEVVCASFNAG
jgi:ATP phosphoribosyltransferase